MPPTKKRDPRLLKQWQSERLYAVIRMVNDLDDPVAEKIRAVILERFHQCAEAEELA